MTNRIPKSFRWIALVAPAVLLGPSCTDLKVEPKDALTPSNAFHTETEVTSGVASVYAALRDAPENDYYNLSEITTDEMIVPTRGQDWDDNGVWREIYRQLWTANSGSALGAMNGAWNSLFGGVARANLLIDVITKAGGANKDQTLAELRTLRAWYYFMLQDFFGGVPLVTSTEVKQNPRVSRDSVFKFIESELKASVGALPDKWPAEFRGRVTKGAANAMLASLYLNAQIFDGTPTANGITKGTARWQDAINAADAVINSGQYSLATTWTSNFSTSNHDSPENIFWVQHTAEPGLGMNFPMRALHYNELAPSPWNGFATIAETYRAYDASDPRRAGTWLVGQQKSFQTGQNVSDRQGNPLIFTDTIGDITSAAENEGPRPNKFSPAGANVTDGNAFPNNYPFFRLGEMYLIKAEALNELGQTSAAITQVNLVRNRVGVKALSPGLSQAEARTAILNERLFELAAEGKRRQDLIRAGLFTNARQFKTAQQAYKVLFPIPATQIQANPLLQQNPGY